ncbi:hypothetical protein [Synechococcus sp. H65.1]|uniref:hypothetical protein n=1 Tax=unclassified Synechococcus TaxID=2626047 RepID=UPI0039C23C74
MADQQNDFMAGVVTGAVVGGILGGIIGFVLAPRLGKGPAEGQHQDPDRPRGTATTPKRPRRQAEAVGFREWEQEAERIAQARRALEAKIAELNEAIQATRAQLLIKETSPGAIEEKS